MSIAPSPSATRAPTAGPAGTSGPVELSKPRPLARPQLAVCLRLSHGHVEASTARRYGTANDALLPTAAQEMAQTINSNGILPARTHSAVMAEQARQELALQHEQAALRRAQKVAEVVAFCGGNQSEAGRLLGIDQAAVNRLAKKARAAAHPL